MEFKNRKTIEKINKSPRWFTENINRIKLSPFYPKEKKRKENAIKHKLIICEMKQVSLLLISWTLKR